MNTDLFGFRWQVPTDGYRWFETHAALPTPNSPDETPGKFLTENRSVNAEGYYVREYNPLKLYPTLFRTFAETEPTPEGVLAFANKYGRLGGDASDWIVLEKLKDDPADQSHAMGWGERIGVWNREILSMRQTLALWDMARDDNREGLARHIRWQGLRRVEYDSHPELQQGETPPAPSLHQQAVIAASGMKREPFLAQVESGDVIRPALSWVQEVANKHLESRVSPRLLWDPSYTELTLQMWPTSLVGALWLQFAQAVSGKTQYRRCRECGTWFELHPNTARTNRQFCSDACRTRAYRGRRDEARARDIAART